MPNVFQKFFRAYDRKEWLIHYLAYKFGVNLYTAAPAVEIQESSPSEPETAALEYTVTPPIALEERFVAESELVISRGVDGMSWVTHKSDLVIGAALRQAGHFQENAIDDCLTFLEALGMKNDRATFLDVGANIGTHSLHAAKLGFEQVYSLEPNPTNFRLLQANIVLNNLDGKVHCRNVAASKESGSMNMELSPSNFGDHRMLTGEEMLNPIHGEVGWNTLEVAVRTLDEVLEEEGISTEALSLVWIDTQGHEGHVLAGAKRLRASRCPLVIEFWPYGLERSGGYNLLKTSLRDFKTIIDLSASNSHQIKDLNLEELDRMFDEMRSAESNLGSAHTDLLLIQ